MNKISKLIKQTGVSLVGIGIGIGSGEFILWPYIASLVGFNLIWGAVMGIIFQIILNIEIQRYSYVTKTTILDGAFKVSKLFGIWFILSTILGFGWPGFATSSATIISYIFNEYSLNLVYLSIFLLFISWSVLVFSKNVFLRIEKIFKIIIPISFIIITIIFINYFDIHVVSELISKISYDFNNIKISLSSIGLPIFLSGVVYAGSGGNLLLLQSFYINEKEDIFKNFKQSRKFQIFENIFIFGGLGLFTILMLSYLGFILTRDSIPGSNNLNFLFFQSEKISVDMGYIFSKLYLISGAFALFFVQLGVIDLLGKITSRIFTLIKKNELKSRGSYIVSVTFIVIFGMLLLLSGYDQPVWLIIVGSVFNSLAMSVLTGVTLFLNLKLSKDKRPSLLINISMVLITLFYLLFFLITIKDII